MHYATVKNVAQVMIEFSAEYALPEMVFTGYNGMTDTSLREITKGIDFVEYLGGGRYETVSLTSL